MFEPAWQVVGESWRPFRNSYNTASYEWNQRSKWGSHRSHYSNRTKCRGSGAAHASTFLES